jgi:hypothetical protein
MSRAYFFNKYLIFVNNQLPFCALNLYIRLKGFSMRVLILSACLLLLSFQTNAYGYVSSSKTTGYVNINLGATQFGFVDQFLEDYEITPSPSLEVLFGGRIGRSKHTWFEFSYAYNGAFKTEDSGDADGVIINTYRNQSISMGIKLTTAPHKKAAAYARLGGGRLMYELRSEIFSNTSGLLANHYQSSLTNHGYLGLGANFAIGRNARLGFEVLQKQYNLNSNALTDNTAMVTFTRYLK